ncbi:hypothetical protein [Entomomonas asaccharolytica]|uniref:Uncharacterized protein n=1 Tax=Entomomonas asaccharolytica TaxID=2785331 RepID=A0A974RW51_9GAMM|nr:hypothetical protein [Entomomonas asaccharolytica]QQP84828.1 hypothetical protein JHT90_10505 [Entomomonas asaccharolytica]
MNKLLCFKEWLTIKEAAKCLSNVFNEKVKMKDVYRLALDNKLILSLHFINSSYVEKGVNLETIINMSTQVNNTHILFDRQYIQIQAGYCYDLVNLYNGQLVIKQGYYGSASHALKINSENNKGIIIKDSAQDEAQPCYYRLVNYLECGGQLSAVTIADVLPKDVLLVVKTEYLRDFINNTCITNNLDKPLHSKERTNLYKLIALLAGMNQLPPAREFKVANIIKTYGDSIGFDCPSSHTIAKCLKEANHYLPIH